MMRLITGAPGSAKTANTLAEFLQAAHRPRFATHIPGFDYDKHGVVRLESLERWPELPDGSLVFCDEAQKFLRPRGRDSASLPPWIADFETHRHRGFDFWFTTQHPMLIDIHVRRLCGEHYHYFRPFGLRTSSLLKWEEVKDDPRDYHAVQVAQRSRVAPPPDIFKEYTSTVLDTHKARFPRKLVVVGVFAAVMVTLSAVLGWRFFHHQPAVVAAVQSAAGVASGAPVSAAASWGGSDKQRALTVSDFRPVSPLVPWSAPVYSGSAHIVSVPRFAGCMAAPDRGCTCYTQQGTTLEVERSTCLLVVSGRGMPFDPLHPDSPDPQPVQPGQNAAQDLAGRSTPSAPASRVLVVGQDTPPPRPEEPPLFPSERPKG